LFMVLVVASPIVIVIRLACARPFQVGKRPELTKYNLLLTLGWLLTATICLVICDMEVARLNKTFIRVGDDFRIHDPILPADGFYYGSSELREDFEKIRLLSVNLENLTAQFIRKTEVTYTRRIPAPFPHNKGIEEFFERTWPGVREAIQEITEAGRARLRGDVEECDRAIERITYLEQRVMGTTSKMAEKGGNLLVALIVLTVLTVLFIVFCTRGLFKNRETREGETNWSLAKRLWGLSGLALIIVLAAVGISMVSLSFHNAIFATRDVLKEAPFGKLNWKASPLLHSSKASMLKEFIELWDVGSMTIYSHGPKPMVLGKIWRKLEALRDQKDVLIRKVDEGLERSKFGPALRIQHNRLSEVVWNLNRVLFHTLLWVGVVGFAHSMLSLLFMI